MKTFGNWLAQTRRAKYNPFGGLSGANVEGDRKRIRRAIGHEQLLQLLAKTREAADVHLGLTGLERSTLYLTVSFTGLRIGSLARLTPEAVEWAGGVPVLLYSRKNKNKKPVGIPIHPEVAAVLGPWLKTREAGLPLWRGVKKWATLGAKLLRHDLAAAGIPYQDAAGEFFDFHSLRVQFGSTLARSGVPLSAAQDLLDHSDPRLTKAVYTRWGKGELAEEIAKMPGLSPEAALLNPFRVQGHRMRYEDPNSDDQVPAGGGPGGSHARPDTLPA